MNACGIMYAIYYLKEVPQRDEVAIGEMELINQDSVVNQNTKNESRHPSQPGIERTIKCSEIFNFKILKDSLSVVIRERKYNGRTVVLLLFLVTVIYNGIFSG